MYAAAILAAIQIGYGLYSSYKSSKEQVPTQSATPQLQASYDRALRESKYGYSPQENAAFDQSLARTNNAQYRNAVIHAGNQLAGSTQSAINFGNINTRNNRSAQDKQFQLQKEHYLDSFSNQFQGMANHNQDIALQMYNREQAASGQLLNSGINNAVWMSTMNNKAGGTTTTTDATDGVFSDTAKSAAAGGATGGFPATKANYVAPTLNDFMNKNVSPYNAPQYDSFGNEIYNPYAPYAH